LDQAVSVLKAWDRSTNVDNRGALLFMTWFGKLGEKSLAVPWDEKDPFNTPKGLKDPKAAVQLLKASVKEMNTKFGSIDVPYGDIFRFRVNQHDVPGNGGPGDAFGIYRTMYFSPDKDKTMIGAAGDSYVAVVEFGPKVIARISLSYGNATQPGTKHLGDQLDLMTAKKLRPALLDRKEILENQEEREELKK
jgi:acyl-homoserine-lactone acylase